MSKNKNRKGKLNLSRVSGGRMILGGRMRARDADLVPVESKPYVSTLV